MKRRSSKFVYGLCRRDCGRRLATLAESIHCNAALKSKYELICDECLTSDEHEVLLNQIAENILINYAN